MDPNTGTCRRSFVEPKLIFFGLAPQHWLRGWIMPFLDSGIRPDLLIYRSEIMPNTGCQHKYSVADPDDFWTDPDPNLGSGSGYGSRSLIKKLNNFKYLVFSFVLFSIMFFKSQIVLFILGLPEPDKLSLNNCFSSFITTSCPTTPTPVTPHCPPPRPPPPPHPSPPTPFSEFAGFILINVNFSPKYLFNLLDLFLVILLVLLMVRSGTGSKSGKFDWIWSDKKVRTPDQDPQHCRHINVRGYCQLYKMYVYSLKCELNLVVVLSPKSKNFSFMWVNNITHDIRLDQISGIRFFEYLGSKSGKFYIRHLSSLL